MLKMSGLDIAIFNIQNVMAETVIHTLRPPNPVSASTSLRVRVQAKNSNILHHAAASHKMKDLARFSFLYVSF